MVWNKSKRIKRIIFSRPVSRDDSVCPSSVSSSLLERIIGYQTQWTILYSQRCHLRPVQTSDSTLSDSFSVLKSLPSGLSPLPSGISATRHSASLFATTTKCRRQFSTLAIHLPVVLCLGSSVPDTFHSIGSVLEVIFDIFLKNGIFSLGLNLSSKISVICPFSTMTRSGSFLFFWSPTSMSVRRRH